MKSGFLILCLALFSTIISAQSFFTLGVNYSTLRYPTESPYGKSLENFKLTPSFGYGYKIKINEKWSYQPGITLGDLGGLDNPSDYYILSATFNQFIDYRPLQWLFFGISPSVYYVGFAGIRTWHRYEDEINRLVLTIVPRVTFHLNERWSADLFYRNDLTSVGDPNPPIPTFTQEYKGYGVGINLKYQIQSKRSS